MTRIVTPTSGSLSSEIISKDGVMMVLVPAGNFLMGSRDDEAAAKADEKPQHVVYLDAFWIDKFEVTNDRYKTCVTTGNCKAHRITRSLSRDAYYDDAHYDNYPVVFVSWKEAETYCEWAGKRLPTEAEWEKAARGTDGRIYPWGNTFDASKVNSKAAKIADTAAVGSYPSGTSPYGVLDMAGNVMEWVADWYDGSYYQNSPRDNPTGPSSGQIHVLRGGSWYDKANDVRVASRLSYLPPEFRYGTVGFRCAQ